ncbi:MAG: zinc ribbon domain-containing protein [Acutalibacteraceae bacterium]
MDCKKCGLPVPDDSSYCNHCGEKLSAETEAYETAVQPTEKKQKEVRSSLPVFALILSALAMNIIGIILATVSLFKFNNFERAALLKETLAASRLSASSKKYAVASIVISVLSIIFALIFIGMMFMTMIREQDIMNDFSL